MDLVTTAVLLLSYGSEMLMATMYEIGTQAPIFVQEPVSRLLFSNDSGAEVACSAHGIPNPLVTWVLKDGSPVNSVPGLRQTTGNGTLLFPPFAGQYLRNDVHEAVYRCKAANQVGTIISRDVNVRAVVRKAYEIRVEGKDVVIGNVAFLRCFIPEHVRDFVTVTSWSRGDEILLPEMADIAGRYAVISGTGDLHIRIVKPDDSLNKFSCVTTNSLSGERRLSDAVYLSVKEITTNKAPRTNQKAVTDMFVDRGNDIHLPCNMQGNPLPVFTWFRVSDSNALYPVPSSQRIMPYQTLLLVKNADERDSGKWVCKASNQFGDLSVEIRLNVNSYTSVHIHPQVQIINSGGTAIFNCSITGTTAAVDNVEWFHNGKTIATDSAFRDNRIKLLTPVSLAVENVGRDDKGSYQCLVTNKKNSAQAIAELKLGDMVPELIYTFIEQSTHPGPHISLKCSANGSPPPQFTWLLDSQPILDVSSVHRYAIGQFVDNAGDVIGHLNISNVRTDDGGQYKCVATNAMGGVEHVARLNVYGPPYIRATGPIKAIAGGPLRIYCPFSGYPIESITWEKSRQQISTGTRYETVSASSGGYLKIHKIDSGQDSGIYTCIVRSRTGEEARRDMQLTVNSPPVIEPFSFPKTLQEGGRAQVTCSVSSGDMPVYFDWRKDGYPIPINLQVTEKKDEFYTLLVFKDISARHSGQYTCSATNSASQVNYTSEMLVKVPPRWKAEPRDTALMLGNAIAINCQADGYPEPIVIWSKAYDKEHKEYRSLPLKNSSLIVNFATDLDEGYYMCQISNGIGSDLKKIIYINVNEPARFDQPMANVSSKRNDAVTLTCLAKGDDPINVIWSHNNARIDLNNYRLNIAEMKINDGVNSQLSISRSDRQDSGLYKCVAENSFGKSEHLIYLAVQESPDTPSNLEILEVSSRSVKLSWRRPFDGNSPVLSYVVQYQPLSSLHAHSGGLIKAENDWSALTTINITLPTISGSRGIDGNLLEQATLAGLHPSTTYMIRMLAVNEIERSAYTDPIVIKTREEAPTEGPLAVHVQTGGIGELIVTWQPPPKSSWNGDLVGYTINCTEERQNINYIGNNDTIRRLIKVDGFATTKALVTELRTYRRYSVSVRATNGFGAGPWSQSVAGTTLEGAPEAPPQNVVCSALSSQSIKIAWVEPLLQFHGGIIQGYKILYRPMMQEIHATNNNEVKRTSNLETYLHALYKATNYSIRVLAYTSAGDGVSSNPIYCCTQDDVPEPPANIKVAALTADSILVSWMPPKHKNGEIQHYTVYSREAGKKGQAKSYMVRVDEEGNPVNYEARGLHENQMYEFWVSAATSVGEGEPTAVVSQITNTRAPARIASFSQIVRKSIGQSLTLQCMAVGNPTPRARWFTRDRPVTFSPFYEVSADGNLRIHSVEQTLSGNYTCSAKNLFGEDSVVYKVVAMKPPEPPQISVHYAASDSIRISWDSQDDGGTAIQGFILQYQTVGSAWHRVDIAADSNAYTINGLRCGTQYVLKLSAMNGVGDGKASDEINVWTKGKKPLEPNETDLLQTNATCIHLNLSAWNNGGCAISQFSIEHRPLGQIRWTVVSSDISNSEENRERLVFCDFSPATWYQLKMAAINDAGRSSVTFNFATTTVNGEPILTPEVLPGNDEVTEDSFKFAEQSDWILAAIVGFIIFAATMLVCLIMKHRGVLCGPISDGYEPRTSLANLKDDSKNRRNQQVYSASPVKAVDKCSESEMYEISPYATFSVAGDRANAISMKTPTRGVNQSTLDYTVQFKTFGHPESDNLNATAYPILPNSGFGHVKGKSSWNKQRYTRTDDESTLSKSMTIMAGSSQLQSHRPKHHRDTSEPKTTSGLRSSSRNEIAHHGESESDTSGSPINDFSNAPTYRIPAKSTRDIFRPDSSTESNNDTSPIERRTSTPRHVTSDLRTRTKSAPRESQSMDLIRAGSNNSGDSAVNSIARGAVAANRNHPTAAGARFYESRECSEAECDRERALDLEVQRVMANGDANQMDREELTTLLERYQEQKEKERQEYIIHV